MEKELTAKDLLVRDELPKEEEVKVEKDLEIADKVEKAPAIPAGYIPVKLSSLGKLGFPAVVHVRDYVFEEAIKMAEISEENVTDTLIEILNGVILEDADVRKAHKQDVLEILLTIYGTWYSPTLENFRYYINLDLPEDQKEMQENISVATIPINSLKTVPLTEDAKLPIKIARGDFEVGLVLPKIENELIATKFITEKYATEENEINEIIKKVRAETATAEEKEIYDELQKRKGRDFLRVAQAMLIDSLNGKKLESVADKLGAVNSVPLNAWAIYNNELKKSFSFGIDQDVTFTCSVTHKPITRRFHFREVHFLPSLVQEDHSGFSVSLG